MGDDGGKFYSLSVYSRRPEHILTYRGAFGSLKMLHSGLFEGDLSLTLEKL